MLDYNLIYLLGVILFIVIGFILVKYLHRPKKHLQEEIVPSGWNFYFRPTSGEPPGTIFRITPDKKKFTVAFIDVKIHIADEVTGTFKQSIKAKMNLVTRFLGLEGMNLFADAEKVQNLVFEMKNPVRETTTDHDIKPSLRAFMQGFSKQEYQDICRKTRYFIIRDALKTKELIYQITEKQIEALGGKASLNEALVTKGTLISSKQRRSHIIKQRFDKQMRVMFNAEEIIIEVPAMAKGFFSRESEGPREFRTEQVKETLEWEEECTDDLSKAEIENGRCSKCRTLLPTIVGNFCPACGRRFKSKKEV